MAFKRRRFARRRFGFRRRRRVGFRRRRFFRGRRRFGRGGMRRFRFRPEVKTKYIQLLNAECSGYHLGFGAVNWFNGVFAAGTGPDQITGRRIWVKSITFKLLVRRKVVNVAAGSDQWLNSVWFRCMLLRGQNEAFLSYPFTAISGQTQLRNEFLLREPLASAAFPNSTRYRILRQYNRQIHPHHVGDSTGGSLNMGTGDIATEFRYNETKYVFKKWFIKNYGLVVFNENIAPVKNVPSFVYVSDAPTADNSVIVSLFSKVRYVDF